MANDDRFKWKCGFCGTQQIGNRDNSSRYTLAISNDASKYGKVCVVVHTIACLNDVCEELTLDISLCNDVTQFSGFEIVTGNVIAAFNLLPRGRAANIHRDVPKAVAADFAEACQIVSISPKAAATLARRALQGMIRDFAGIKKDRLIDEVKELKRLVDDGKGPADVSPQSVIGIDKIREIGNIGAHMEKDIGLIIEIDPDEANMLLDLVEQLFEDWYAARAARNLRLSQITKIAEDKKAQKNGSLPSKSG